MTSIAIVEDHEVVGEWVAEWLREDDPTFIIDLFPTRAAAEAGLAAKRYDLVMTNIDLGGGDETGGIKLIQTLLDRGHLRPVIVFSGFDDGAYRDAVVDLYRDRGIAWDYYLLKPAGHDAMLALVRRALADATPS